MKGQSPKQIWYKQEDEAMHKFVQLSFSLQSNEQTFFSTI